MEFIILIILLFSVSRIERWSQHSKINIEALSAKVNLILKNGDYDLGELKLPGEVRRDVVNALAKGRDDKAMQLLREDMLISDEDAARILRRLKTGSSEPL